MDNKEVVMEQFGKNAENYVTSQIHAKGKDLAVLAEVAKENQGDYVLDIATGGGHVANALASLYEKVVALDLTKAMLEKAEAFIVKNGHQNVSFVQGDAENLPFLEESFDTVTCRIAPHHFSHVNLFVKEVHRVLKEKGLFLLIDNVASEIEAYDQFYNEVEKRRDPSHYRAYKKTEWVALLEQEGFSVETFTSFKKTFLFENWCKIMALAEEEKVKLNDFMVASSVQVKQFFAIDVVEQQIESFQGEAALFVVRKR